MNTQTPSAPDKLPAAAIFALLDGAPFGRLATYAPPADGATGRCYVVPLQFVHREGRIYLITTPGRKLTNLRAAPHGVCFQLDLSEGAGWTSVCAWGDYTDVPDLRERVSAIMAAFSKYPDRTSHQALSWFRQHTPHLGRQGAQAAARALAVGRIDITSMSGRSWPGLLLSAGNELIHPAHRHAFLGPRTHPVALDAAGCWAVLNSRPLARLGCYHPSKDRTYCLPLWYAVEARDLWFYHPRGGVALFSAIQEHPQGVCAQVDNLDCSPEADPGQPWRSVVADGAATVFPLGSDAVLPRDRQRDILRAIRTRLHTFGIESVFVPPDPDLTPPQGMLLRLRLARMSGQATGGPA